MRHLLASILLTFALGLTLDSAAQSQDVNVAISNETSREQLWEIRNDLAAEGLNFEYHPLFNNERVLTGITIKVSNNDGQVLSYEDTTLTDGEVIKVIRTTGDNDEVNFCVGLCED
jgi:hypothetical protein